ncbi:putative ribonuclease H-like domain-containing protein [Tanacetum coccineum]
MLGQMCMCSATVAGKAVTTETTITQSLHQAEIWATKGLLDKAKGNVLGDCDVVKNASADVGMLDGFDRGLQTDVQVFVDFDYAMGRSITVMEAAKEAIWLKGLVIESGFELNIVAGVATCALSKAVPRSKISNMILRNRVASILSVGIAQITAYSKLDTYKARKTLLGGLIVEKWDYWHYTELEGEDQHDGSRTAGYDEIKFRNFSTAIKWDIFQMNTKLQGVKTIEIGKQCSSSKTIRIEDSFLSLQEFKQPEVNEYGPRDSSVMPTTGCDKESDNSKENTDDSLKQQQKTDSSSVKSPLKVDKDWKEKFFCPANQVREEEPKKARENNDAPIIEDWVSDDEDDVEPIPKVEKKTVIPTATKKEFVKPETPVRRSVRQNVNTVRARGFNVVKPSACWVWKPIKPNGASLSNSQLNDKGFRSKGAELRITGKGTIKTDKLDFDDVYFVKELKFNLFSVSQMCDKKNYVLFTDSECLVLSPNFKLPDENQILLKIPRQDNMYSFDMKNIVPKDGLTCLVAKATSEESMLWHRRLGHVNFKNINKLVKENLVRDLPLKRFENDQTCVACLKGKQHRASCKTKAFSPITKPLFMLHMDLFGPTFVSSLMHKKYCLVVTDDYSRFSWVFFLRTKDETSEILKNFIKEIENLVDKKVKIIRSDNGTEFKNNVMDEFCREKGIKREYSVARTPQQNGVAERKNRTLIEAARTMLADSKLPTTFWAEAVSTACYVQNRVEISTNRESEADDNRVILSAMCQRITRLQAITREMINSANTSVTSKNKVEANPRKVVQIVLWYLDSGCLKHMTGDRSQLTNFINFDELTAMASEQRSSGPTLHEMTLATIRSGLVPNPPPSTLFVPPSRTDWDILFQPLFDELLISPPSVDYPAPEVVAPIHKVVAPVPVVSTGSPFSTNVDQDEPSPSNSQTTPKTQPPIIPNDVE